MKPTIKIGLTYTGTDEKHHNYENWLKAGDGDIEVIKLSAEDNNLDVLETLQGVVLSGGVDTHPRYYNSTVLNYPNAPDRFNEARDQFEKEVFESALTNRLPLLAICRGMQLVNCLLGGTLTQDIGPVANTVHRFENNDKAHGTNIISGTLMHQITGVERTVSNSAHHQAIDKPGKGLAINSKADDGIIEGIEWEDKNGKPFFIGVQWHPERMYTLNLQTSPASKNIRESFIAAVKDEVI